MMTALPETDISITITKNQLTTEICDTQMGEIQNQVIENADFL